MGLAASQARLLLLTSRKSDLEYRAQMISQRKVLLAMQTEEIAMNYSQALNNRKLHYRYQASANENNTKTEALTYENFTAVNSFEAGDNGGCARYRLIDSTSGKLLVTSLDEVDRFVSKTGFTTYTPVAEGENGQAGQGIDTGSFDEAAWQAEVDDLKANGTIVCEALNNSDFLQDALQSGRILIQECKVKARVDIPNENTEAPVQTAGNVKWEYVVLSGMENVQSKLYADDDAAATAEYEYQSLIIQSADKQLDVELKQVETQQKACENEIDSVKKILDKNIEKSFKTFA